MLVPGNAAVIGAIIRPPLHSASSHTGSGWVATRQIVLAGHGGERFYQCGGAKTTDVLQLFGEEAALIGKRAHDFLRRLRRG